MPYPILRTGGSVTLSSQLFDSSNYPMAYPEGTTFSAFTTDSGIATASAGTNGVVTVTPNGSVTGNVYVTVYATIPGNVADIAGTILVHVMDAPLSEGEYIQLTPQ